MPVQIEKNFLGHFLGQRPILQEVIPDAENHGLMLADRRFKRHSPVRFSNGLPWNTRLLRQDVDHWYPSHQNTHKHP
jgi:hypothetical protein